MARCHTAPYCCSVRTQTRRGYTIGKVPTSCRVHASRAARAHVHATAVRTNATRAEMQHRRQPTSGRSASCRFDRQTILPNCFTLKLYFFKKIVLIFKIYLYILPPSCCRIWSQWSFPFTITFVNPFCWLLQTNITNASTLIEKIFFFLETFSTSVRGTSAGTSSSSLLRMYSKLSSPSRLICTMGTLFDDTPTRNGDC